MGWTSLENVLDTNFEYANYRLADYIVFALRIDTRKVPPSLLKLRALEAEKIFMEEKNKKKIYREQKKEIREAVRAKLLSEIPPTPSFYEICWSASKGWLVFGSIAKNVAEDFEGFFERSFKLKLVPSVPWNVVDSENEIASAAGKSGYGVSEEDNR
jgi:recombination associated protein RdgC